MYIIFSSIKHFFCEKIMQQALTALRQSEDDHFANNSEENVEEVGTHCRRCPSKDGRFATCGLLTISVFWEAVRKNNSPLEGWKKQLLITVWKSAPTQAKFSSTAPSQCMPSTTIRVNGKVKVKWTSSNTWDPHKPSMEPNQGSKDQTGTDTQP